MKKLIILFSALLAVLSAGCYSGSKKPMSQTAFMLDTVSTITVYDYSGNEDINTIINNCFALCSEYEKKLSRTIDTSEITKINTSKGEPTEISADTAQLISLALDFSEISGGKFDITIDPVSSLWDFKADSPAPPSDKEIKAALEHVGYGNIELNGTSIKLSDPNSALDLGGIAKGFIGDKAKEFLLENGVKEAMISLGGNILIICPENRDFKIGVQKPFGMDGQLIGAIVTSGNSIVTSGIYQRYFEYNGKLYHHILDTSTGYPVDNGLASVTITGPSSAVCDALSTTVFCLGADDGLDLINSIDGYEAIIITKENKTVYSDGINKSVTFLTNS